MTNLPNAMRIQLPSTKKKLNLSISNSNILEISMLYK